MCGHQELLSVKIIHVDAYIVQGARRKESVMEV